MICANGSQRRESIHMPLQPIQKHGVLGLIGCTREENMSGNDT